MRISTRAAIASAFLAVGTQAGAHAYADVSFAGLNLSQQGSGTQFNVFFFGQPIPAGTSFTQTFPYTITLHSDGGPAERSWDFCLPLPGTDCGPPPTGFEQVEFEYSFSQTKEASPFTSYTFANLPNQTSVVENGGTLTLNGSFSITETMAEFGDFEPLDYLVVWGATWVDSNDAVSTIPEPGMGSLLLLGVGMLGAGRRLRSWRRCSAGPSAVR
jgi:hypothetical protein